MLSVCLVVGVVVVLKGMPPSGVWSFGCLVFFFEFFGVELS